jgi:hypothetical protein
VIGVAAATRRALVLFWPAVFAGKYPPAAAMDKGFAQHAALTLVHIIPGALFLVLAPLQFAPAIRTKHLNIHRWLGRILVVSALVIGSSALVMTYTMNIGGANETAATTLFGILFLFVCDQSLLAHPPQRSCTTSRVDDSHLRHWPRNSDDPADCGDVFCFSQAHTSRVLRDCILAGIHDYISGSRGVDRLYPATYHSD